MKTRGRCLAALGMILGLACWASPASATTGTTQDSVTVTITPVANYLLLVSTGGPVGGLALGNVSVLESTYTMNPTTVTVYSDYATTGIQVEGLVTGGTLVIEPNPSAANLDADTDKVGLWAVFTDTGMGVQPQPGWPAADNGTFAGTAAGATASTVVQGGVFNNVGLGAGDGYTLTSGTPHFKSMRSVPTHRADAGGSASELWLKVKLSPLSAITSGTPQSLTVVLKAVAAF